MTTPMPANKSHLSGGIAMALGAAVLFGLSAPLAKELLRDAPPQLLAGLLYSGSGIGLALLATILSQRGYHAEASLTKPDVPWLGAAIFFGGIIGPVLLMVGLSRTPASSASLLLNLEAAFTAVLAWTVFRENTNRRIILGMALIVLGGAILTWEGRVALGGVSGPIAVAAACLCWAIDNNLTQKVSAADPIRIAMLKGLVAGVVNVSLATFLGAGWPGSFTVAAAGVLGFFGYGLSLVLFVFALRRLGTARTSAYFSAAPFIGAIVGLVIWHESATPSFLLGGAFMLAGLTLHLTERHMHFHVHEPLDHTHSHVHDEHHQHSHSADDPIGEPHTHRHIHEPLAHSHRHFPDIHHRHDHG